MTSTTDNELSAGWCDARTGRHIVSLRGKAITERGDQLEFPKAVIKESRVVLTNWQKVRLKLTIIHIQTSVECAILIVCISHVNSLKVSRILQVGLVRHIHTKGVTSVDDSTSAFVNFTYEITLHIQTNYNEQRVGPYTLKHLKHACSKVIY